MVVTKANAKIGMTIFYAVDDRPFEFPTIEKGVISKIEDDHFLFDLDNGCEHVWGEYDEDSEDILTSCITFTTENAANDWLRKRG